MNVDSHLRVIRRPVARKSPKLSRLIFLLIALYPLESHLYLFKNVSLIDVLAISLYVYALFNRRFGPRLLALYFESRYAVLVWPFLALLAISTAMASNPAAAAVLAAQYAFIFLVIVPLLSVGVRLHREPVRAFFQVMMVYVVANVVGLLLNFSGVYPLLVQNSGSNRYFGSWELALQISTIAAAIATSSISLRRMHMVPGLLAATMATACTFFAASRAGALGIGAALAASMLIAASRHGFSLRKPLLILFAAASIALYTAESTYSRLGVVNRTAEFFSDEQRAPSYLYPILETLRTPRRLLIGTGPGNFEWMDQVIHNVFLEVFIESGLPAFIGFSLLMLLPLIQLFAREHPRDDVRRICGVVFISLLPFLLFHPLSTQRVYWIPYAFLLGVSSRTYRRKVWNFQGSIRRSDYPGPITSGVPSPVDS